MLSCLAVTLSPLDYLPLPFSPENFPDLFNPVWAAALGLLLIQVVLYNVRTRQLHRHEPLRTMQEWLLWTGLCVFGLIFVAALFRFYFFIVLGTIIVGLATYVWVRFMRFPPLIEAYNDQLRRARFFSQARYKNPEATVRSRSRPARRRR